MTETEVKNKHYFLPGLADYIFILALYIMLYLKPDMILSDGSTGWHLVTGNYILQHHQIPHTDIMSYTFANKPWVAYEWLSDLFMAILVKLGGLSLLLVSAACAIAYLFSLLYKACRDNGCNFLQAFFLTITGGIVSTIHWLARPHLFTFFGVFIFTTLLSRYYQGSLSKKKLAIFLTLYMLLWANCHPGFILGLLLIGLYLLSSIIEYFLFDQNQNKSLKAQSVRWLGLCFVLSVGATLCTPYGTGLYSYIFHYLVQGSSVVAATDEFLSPVFHGSLQPFLLETFFALFIIGLALSKRRIALPDLLVYLAFAYLSLSAQRNMAIYIIVALPIISRLYADTVFNPVNGSLFEILKKPWRNLISQFNNLNQGFTENEQACSSRLLSGAICLLLILIACAGGKVFGVEILQDRFAEYRNPNSTLAMIKKLHLKPEQGVALDNWGGIIRYQLDYPVFIDDRSDFYGEPFYLEYGRLILTSEGWQKIMDKYHINWVLLPKNYRLIQALKADNHWQLVAEDQASALMVRKEDGQK